MPMAATTFDTHKFIRKLKDSGMPEAQAEAIADAFKDAQSEAELATKRDLKELEAALKRDIDDLRRDMREMEQRLIIKLGGMMMAAIAIVATLVKLL